MILYLTYKFIYAYDCAKPRDFLSLILCREVRLPLDSYEEGDSKYIYIWMVTWVVIHKEWL
jgi:hypothetical protein